MKNKTIIFVHPSLWGGNLINEAKNLNYSIFVIVTTFETTRIQPDYLRAHSDVLLEATSDPNVDIAKIKALIAEHSLEICAIINGVDASLYYTDCLQKEFLGYPIDLTASKIRLNKYAVNNALKNHHLPIIPAVEVKNLAEYQSRLATIKSFGLPLVIKPTENTAANAGVKIVQKLEDVPNTIKTLLGTQNAYYKDKSIEKVLVQKCLPSNKFRELAFDFISFAGEHRCIGILEYSKTSTAVIKDIYPYVVGDVPNIMPVINYVCDCLNSLKVSYGFTHTEVFWNEAENEYYVIEVNNRYAGMPGTPCYFKTYQNGPLTNYFNLMSGKPVEMAPSIRIGYSAAALLYNLHVDYPDKLNLEKLQSTVISTTFRANNQKRLAKDFYKNYDIPSQVGAIVILHSVSAEPLQRDLITLRKMEKQGNLFLQN